jgi:hypothetical protein
MKLDGFSLTTPVAGPFQQRQLLAVDSYTASMADTRLVLLTARKNTHKKPQKRGVCFASVPSGGIAPGGWQSPQVETGSCLYASPFASSACFLFIFFAHHNVAAPFAA